MNNYSNPMVTYDEIVEALRAIIDCSKASGYLDDYGFLNVKYDSVKQNPIQKEQEQALLKALQSLEKTLLAANKVVRETLEKELDEITAVSMFTISANYEHSCEKRKLASQNDLVMKLKEMSLPLEILNKVEEIETVEELPAGFEEIVDEDDIEKIETVDEEVQKEPELEIEAVELDMTDEEEIEENEKEEEFEEEPSVEEQEEERVEEQKSTASSNVDASKIQLIKKALDKAREKGNEQLVKVLEQQLLKELENLK